MRLVALLLLLSLCVSAQVFWFLRQTGIAMAGEAHCGLTEHSHSSECGEGCAEQEHTHTVSCYSDEAADVESKADWETTLTGVPYTEDFASDLIAVAKTQIGYRESRTNFKLNEEGERNGYTRYGQWYGNPYGDWSAMFVSFCLYYTGVPIGILPMNSGPEAMRLSWDGGEWYRGADEAPATPGALVFFDSDEDGSAEYVGIVGKVTETELHVIHGGRNDSVEEALYTVGDQSIMGYVPTDGIPAYMAETGTLRLMRSVALPSYTGGSSLNSDSQIIKYGGENIADDGTRVSKTIAGTDIENVFDITLRVQTHQTIKTVYEEPNMAVVIVMDISNTMVSNTLTDGKTRYDAAVTAASDFLTHFAEETGSVSEIGFVAFNSHAHKIFDMQSCGTLTKANSLINEMKTETQTIVNRYSNTSSDYYLKDRFTNIEAGLKMGWDMVKDSHCEHKYVIFLSDGFPTTYLINHNGTDYKGYDPNTAGGTVGKDGTFYDSVLKRYCTYGTSYSDKAAIYGRQMATKIKDAGGTVFSIGIDIGGQTIQKYVDQSASSGGFSVVDRTGTTYELGSASSTSAYKNWLRDSIGSGYYYDSTNTQGLKDAYNQIFSEIQRIREEQYKAEWIACDPLPIMEDSSFKTVDFIGFYDKTGAFVPMTTSTILEGTHSEGAENSAVFVTSADEIDWDLKSSGYTSTTSGDTTYYEYTLKYRVRLRNEDPEFVEHTEYYTNDITTLRYRIIETVDGEEHISEARTINFPLPSVEGYLGELSFMKIDPHGGAVVGAEFTLSHDTANCNICHGDGTPVTTVPDYVAISDENGKVTFTEIPSGHRYTMTETGIPSGYLDTGRSYWATVSYDVTTVNVASKEGAALEWDGTVLNYVPYGLPVTGGAGTKWYTIVGSVLIILSVLFLWIRHRRAKRRMQC